jgi:hypothetical protein
MARLVRRDAERNAVAAAAEIEPEYEAWLFQRAAPHARAQAEAAMKTINGRRPARDVSEQRIPDQRAVAEYPHVLAGIVRRQQAFERGVEFGLGQDRQVVLAPRAGFAQGVVFEVFARQCHTGATASAA